VNISTNANSDLNCKKNMWDNTSKSVFNVNFGQKNSAFKVIAPIVVDRDENLCDDQNKN
jgi:hypothetical protein